MRRALLVAILSLTLHLGLATGVSAATITVNSFAQSPGLAGDCTLGEAIQAANTDMAVDGCTAGSGDDTIMVPAGTYTLTAADNMTGGPTGLPVVTSSITFQGANAATTIIEGRAGRLLALFGGGLPAAVVLNDLTLRSGFAGVGGAILSSGPTLTVNRCVFANNGASIGGAIAGIFSAVDSFILVTDSTFANNGTVSEGIGGLATGGAISAEPQPGTSSASGSLNISNSTFFNNVARGSNEGIGIGGAVACGGLSVTCEVTDSTFVGNRSDQGGAVVAEGDVNRVAHCVFIENVATSAGPFGGAGGALMGSNPPSALVVGSSLEIDDSFFSENTAIVAGGAILSGNSVVTITGSTFSGNAAARGGAALLGGGLCGS